MAPPFAHSSPPQTGRLVQCSRNVRKYAVVAGEEGTTFRGTVWRGGGGRGTIPRRIRQIGTAAARAHATECRGLYLYDNIIACVLYVGTSTSPPSRGHYSSVTRGNRRLHRNGGPHAYSKLTARPRHRHWAHMPASECIVTARRPPDSFI